jgi:hypothetical protein
MIMELKHKDLIKALLKAEIADTEFSVNHCKENELEELRGQVKKLSELNEAYCSILLIDTISE